MIRILKRLSFVGLLAAVVLPLHPTARAANPAASIQVVAQEFELIDDTTLSLVVHVEAPEEQLAGGDIKVRLLQRVTDYKTFVDAQNDLSLKAIDQVNYKASSLARSPEGDYLMFIGIDRSGADKESLNIRESGVYPLAVVFQNGDMRVTSTVFVQARASTDAAPIPLDTTFLFNVQGKPAVQPDGVFKLDDTFVAQLNAMVDVFSSSRFPMIIGTGPEALEGLASSDETADQVLMRKVRRSLASQPLTAQTYVPIDPSAAARAGLTNEFNRQMRLGEDVMASLFTSNPTQRQLWIAETALDSFGANLIRNSGARTTFLLPSALEVEPDPVNYPLLAPRTALLSGGSSIEVATVDPFIAAALPATSEHPSVDAANAMAHLVVASELAAADEKSVVHQVFVSSFDGSIPDANVLAEFMGLVATSPFVNITSDVATADSESQYAIPIRSSVELSGTAVTINELSATVAAASSMLPADDPNRLSWSLTSARAASNRLTVDECNAYTKFVYDAIGGLFEKISIPTKASFTLPAKTSEIRLQLRNDADVDLSVRVQLVSSKLIAQEASQLVLLKAGATTDVPVKVRARSSGRFQIELQVTTPDGNRFVAPPARLSARVTGLAGIGQVVSGALLLLILTWWVAHFRRNRRAALSEGTVQ